MNNLIPSKSFLIAFLPGFLAGIFILSISKKSQSSEFFNNLSDTNVPREVYVTTDNPDITTTGNRISSTNQNELTKRLEIYSHYSPEEIENELVVINRELVNGSSNNDKYPLIISLYYLVNKWTKTSPVEALNFKKTNGIHGLIFGYWHDGLNSHIWDLMVETGSASSGNREKK